MTTTILVGNALEKLSESESESFQAVITSPPYWGLRDYGTPPQGWPEVAYRPMPGLPEMVTPQWVGELGQEPDPFAYVGHLASVFREVWRVLKPSGTVWLNIGDSYASSWAVNRRNIVGEGSMEDGTRPNRPNRAVAGLKEKDLCGIPWRLALALQADGWTLRQDVIWEKPNPMPESVQDRCTKAHEYLFLLTKADKGYFYDHAAVKEPAVGAGRAAWNNSAVDLGQYGRVRAGLSRRAEVSETRNRRSVWRIPVSTFKEAHFATFPAALVEICLRASTSPGDAVLDPFGGAGTVGLVAQTLGREATLIELNPDYVEIANTRLRVTQGGLL